MEEIDLGIFNDEDVQAYVGIKGIQALMCTTDFDQELEYLKEYLDPDDPNLLSVLIVILDSYHDMIDNDMRNNVLKIISYFRFTYAVEHPEEKKEVYELCNKVLESLSKCDDSRMSLWACDQTRVRYNSAKYGFSALINPNDAIPYLKLLMVDDLEMIVTHSPMVTDEEFEEFASEITNIDYLLSMGLLMTECEALFTDPLFVKRVRYITSRIKEKLATSEEYCDDYPIKKAEKIYKKYEKNLNKHTKGTN